MGQNGYRTRSPIVARSHINNNALLLNPIAMPAQQQRRVRMPMGCPIGGILCSSMLPPWYQCPVACSLDHAPFPQAPSLVKKQWGVVCDPEAMTPCGKNNDGPAAPSRRPLWPKMLPIWSCLDGHWEKLMKPPKTAQEDSRRTCKVPGCSEAPSPEPPGTLKPWRGG